MKFYSCSVRTVCQMMTAALQEAAAAAVRCVSQNQTLSSHKLLMKKRRNVMKHLQPPSSGHLFSSSCRRWSSLLWSWDRIRCPSSDCYCLQCFTFTLISVNDEILKIFLLWGDTDGMSASYIIHFSQASFLSLYLSVSLSLPTIISSTFIIRYMKDVYFIFLCKNLTAAHLWIMFCK